MATKKEKENKELIEKIKKIKIEWLNFWLMNDKVVATINSATILNWNAEKIKVLYNIWKIIADNKNISVKSFIFKIEKAVQKRIEALKILNKITEENPDIKQFIVDDLYPYKIEELEKEVESDPYSITDSEGNRVNILYDLLLDVSKLTKFVFEWNGRLIWSNMTSAKNFIKKTWIEFDELKEFFYNIYKKFIYDWYKHKSIMWFLLSAEEYFNNKEETQNVIKCIFIYFECINKKPTSLIFWDIYKRHRQDIVSILDNIWNNVDTFKIIVSDYSTFAKNNQFNWNLSTVFKNIHKRYSKYVIYEEEKNISNDNKKESIPEELNKLFKELDITDDTIIKELTAIYNKKWIEWVYEIYK